MINVAQGAGPLVAASRDISRRSVVVGLGFAGLAAAFSAAGWTVEVSAQEATPAASPVVREFNAMVVLYNHPEDSAAFQDYLFTTHVPLVLKVPGLKNLMAHTDLMTTELIAGDVYLIGTVIFSSQADLEEGLTSDEAQAAMADLGNFATGGFTSYLGHVLTIPTSGMTRPLA